MRMSDRRVEDRRLLTGEGRFVANLAATLAPDAAVVWFVRATVAHAVQELCWPWSPMKSTRTA